jgi:hypothetical protein
VTPSPRFPDSLEEAIRDVRDADQRWGVGHCTPSLTIARTESERLTARCNEAETLLRAAIASHVQACVEAQREEDARISESHPLAQTNLGARMTIATNIARAIRNGRES